MNKLIPAVLVLLIFVSCKQSQTSTVPENFSQAGVSLTVPSRWSISEQEAMAANGYYLSIEKEGFTSSGIITVVWYDGEVDPSETIESQQAEMRESTIYKYSSLKFESIEEGNFNGVSCFVSHYKMSILTVPHRGTIYAFNDEERTFMILKQEAIEDISRNEPGFEAIEKSFQLGK